MFCLSYVTTAGFSEEGDNVMIRDARGGDSKRKVSHVDFIHAFDMLRTGLQEENDIPQDCVYSLDKIQRIWQQTRAKRKKNSPTLT